MAGTHKITEVEGEGLVLEVDDAPVATIRDRGGNRDLIWSIRGPKDLEVSRRIVMGLLDMLVQYDALKLGPVNNGTRAKGG